VDPDLPLIGIETQRDGIAGRMADERALAKLVSLFGAMALLLATVGLHGTISYSPARRSGEIGIRMAVGAARRDVVRMVFGKTFLLVAAGFVIGVPIALMNQGRLQGRAR
jgi:macrolide transport system ATP-binding/permease protein